jgi:hypothetical protein
MVMVDTDYEGTASLGNCEILRALLKREGHEKEHCVLNQCVALLGLQRAGRCVKGGAKEKQQKKGARVAAFP